MRLPRTPSRRPSSALPLTAICGLLVLSISCANAAQPIIKGLDPALASHYRPQSGIFVCLDHSTKVAFDRVNDDFCDCTDGSDEPGTSACPAGHFYCRNRGHQPRLLNSSSVNDRICDCCDGSDEAPGVCANTCAEAGAANRAALKARSAAFKQGLKARAKYVKEAVSSRQAWQAEVAQLKEEEASLTKTVAQLQAQKTRIEKQEARERAREEAARKPAEQQAAAAAGQGEPEAPQAEAAAQPEGEPAQAEAPAAEPQQQAEPEQEQEAEEELSEEEKGRRIAAQWTHDPEAVGGEGEHQQRHEAPPPAEAEAVEAVEAAVESAAQQALEQQEEEEEEAEEAEAPPVPASAFAAARAWLAARLGLPSLAPPPPVGRRQAVKDAYFAQNGRLTEAARRRAELEGRLAGDYGSEDALLPLVDRCFEAQIEKYTYEVCPFKSAAQKDGGLSTSLGSWQGLEPGPTLVFANGQHCWNGPNRSLRVALECGASEELSAVEEPNRCEYKAKLRTPAACSAEEAEAVQKAYEAAEAELSAARDELRRL